jgi:hypothetical protein
LGFALVLVVSEEGGESGGVVVVGAEEEAEHFTVEVVERSLVFTGSATEVI